MTRATRIEDIDVRSYELEGVRKAPGMYVGGTDPEALRIIVKEVIDNAADQMTKGAATKAFVARLPNGHYAVWDDGEGIPVEVHPVAKLPGLTVVMTQLHAGTKSSAKTKDRFRGVHGVGVSVTNALSSLLSVYTFRDKAWYNQVFARGQAHSPVTKATLPDWTKTLPKDVRPTKGTLVVFCPDASLFKDGTDVPHETLRGMVQANAYVLPKTQWSYLTPKTVAMGKATEWQAETFCAPGGLLDLLKDTMQAQASEPHGKPFVFVSDDISVVAQWTTGQGVLASSVNGSPTPRGGTHLTAVLTTLKASLPEGKIKLAPEDCTNGLVCLVDAKVLRPTFNAQTKDALRSELLPQVSQMLLDSWKAFWAANKKQAQEVFKQSVAYAQERQEHAARKAELRTLSSSQREAARVSKVNFRPAQNKDLTQCTLFLVEGKSAGGCAVNARNPKTQAILFMRGKVLNVLKASKSRALKNAEIATLLNVLGYSEKDPHWADKTYKEIVLMVDPDEDGNHISLLLHNLLHLYAPALLEQGRVLRVTDAALFKTYVKGTYIFGKTLADVQRRAPASAHITRIKGWGEIDPATLKYIAMDPATRQLIRLGKPDKHSTALLELLMSDGAASLTLRRSLLGLPPKSAFEAEEDNLGLDAA